MIDSRLISGLFGGASHAYPQDVDKIACWINQRDYGLGHGLKEERADPGQA